MILQNRDEEDLRWFFGAGLSIDGGLRSPTGAQLDAFKWELPMTFGGVDPYANHDRLVGAVGRERSVRRALAQIKPWQAHVLRVAYGSIPHQMVWGLVPTFGTGPTHKDGRETAALAVSWQTIDAPGASQWEPVNAMVRSATNGSSKAKGEVKDLVEWCHRALLQSRCAYRDAVRAVKREDRERRLQRSDDLLDLEAAARVYQ